MAEKILNTRLKLRYDSHENWVSKDPVLLAGELALSTVSVKQDGVVNTVPSVLIKCGDGTHKYSELDFVFAKAADVIAAAKSEATLTTFINNVIADAGIATDEALTTLAGRVDDLEGLVGSTEVAVQISDAIAALKLGETYDVKGAAAQALIDANAYTDGKDSAMNTRVASLEAKFGEGAGTVESQIAAAVKVVQDDVDALEQTHATDKAALEGSIAEAKKAGDDAQADVDALAAKVGEVPAEKTVVQMIADAQAAATYDDAEVKADIAALEGLVGATPVATQIADAVAGEKTRAEEAEATLQGNIDTLAGRVTDNEEAIGTLNGNSSVEGSVDKKIADAINKFATDVSSDETVNTYKELIDYAASHGAEFTELVGEVDANTAAIATLNGDANTVGSVDKKVADAVKSVADRVTAAEGEIDTLQTDLDTAEAAIDALEALVGSTAVSAQIAAAIEALKIGDYAKAADLTAAVARIAKNETDIAGLTTRMGEAEADIATKANDADLAAIAKSGNVNDLIQTEGDVLVFDCGNAGV